LVLLGDAPSTSFRENVWRRNKPKKVMRRNTQVLPIIISSLFLKSMPARTQTNPKVTDEAKLIQKVK